MSAAVVVCAEAAGLTRADSASTRERTGLLRDVFATLTDVAVAHRAWIHWQDERFLLLFGTGRREEGDAARAVRAALAMRHAVLGVRNRWSRRAPRLATELRLRAGIVSGEVDAVPEDRRVTGAAIDRAASLCGRARAAEVLADAGVVMQIRGGGIRLTRVGDREESGAVYRCELRRQGLRVATSPGR